MFVEQLSKDKLKVYFLYNRTDADTITHIYERLKTDGFQPWMFTNIEDLGLGGNEIIWIRKEIASTDFILIFFHTPIEEPIFNIQLHAAKEASVSQNENKAFVTPIFLERSLSQAELPEWLKQYKVIYYQDSNFYNNLWKSLRKKAQELKKNTPSAILSISPDPIISEVKSSSVHSSTSVSVAEKNDVKGLNRQTESELKKSKKSVNVFAVVLSFICLILFTFLANSGPLISRGNTTPSTVVNFTWGTSTLTNTRFATTVVLPSTSAITTVAATITLRGETPTVSTTPAATTVPVVTTASPTTISSTEALTQMPTPTTVAPSPTVSIPRYSLDLLQEAEKNAKWDEESRSGNKCIAPSFNEPIVPRNAQEIITITLNSIWANYSNEVNVDGLYENNGTKIAVRIFVRYIDDKNYLALYIDFVYLRWELVENGVSKNTTQLFRWNYLLNPNQSPPPTGAVGKFVITATYDIIKVDFDNEYTRNTDSYVYNLKELPVNLRQGSPGIMIEKQKLSYEVNGKPVDVPIPCFTKFLVKPL
jgi:hypothetical protein